MWAVFLLGAMGFVIVAMILCLLGSKVYIFIKRQNKQYEIEEETMQSVKEKIKDEFKKEK